MKISTRFILSISIIILGYIITLTVSYVSGYRTQHQLDYASEVLFPAVIETRDALASFGKQVKAYESAVVLGEESFLNDAKDSGLEVQKAMQKILDSKNIPEKYILQTKKTLQSMSAWMESADRIYPVLIDVGLEEMGENLLITTNKLNNSREIVHTNLKNLVILFTDGLSNENKVIIKHIRLQGQSNLILFCIVIIISLAAFTVLIRKIVGPIQALAETANQIKAGEFNTKSEVTSTDEIGELAGAFNSMTDKISHSVKELEEEVLERKRAQEEVAMHRDNLEELVNERTEELSYANIALQEAEAKSRSILENSPDFIINVDREFIVQYANKSMGNSDLESVIGESIFNFMVTSDQDSLKNAIIKAFQSGKGEMLETEIEISEGKISWYENRFAPIKGESAVSDVMIISTDITKRKLAEDELNEANKKLVENAHKAGMADIASGTLHNVGNILNSLKTSAQVLSDIQDSSQYTGFKKANSLLKENIDTIEEFISTDPKGKKLMQYYIKLEEGLDLEQKKNELHLTRLVDKITAIEEVIVAQQSYAGTSSLTEKFALSEIIDDALTMQSGTTERYSIKIIKEFKDIPDISVQKTKLVHILINLIKNAKDAMFEIPPEDRLLKISIDCDETSTIIKVTDSGHGILGNDLKKIFIHGFTTKNDGHGFGLHSSANYMTEMGGEMWGESEGPGKGATFVLKFKND